MFNRVDTSWPFGALEYQHVNRVQYFEYFWGWDFLLNPIAFIQNLQYISYLGDMAVHMPDRGLVFKCASCFYCSKGVTFVVDCVKCVPIPVRKEQDDLPFLMGS